MYLSLQYFLDFNYNSSFFQPQKKNGKGKIWVQMVALISITKRDSTKLWREVTHSIDWSWVGLVLNLNAALKEDSRDSFSVPTQDWKTKPTVGVYYYIFVNLKIHRLSWLEEVFRSSTLTLSFYRYEEMEIQKISMTCPKLHRELLSWSQTCGLLLVYDWVLGYYTHYYQKM